MKTKVFIPVVVVMFSLTGTFAQDATEIVKKANDKMQGEITSQSIMTMTIVRPTWERKISFKSWTKGRDYSLALITSPPKEQGQTFLKRGNEMWSWSPIINRLIKLRNLLTLSKSHRCEQERHSQHCQCPTNHEEVLTLL